MSLVGNQESVNNRIMTPHNVLFLRIPLNLFTLPSCPVDNNREFKQSRQRDRGQCLVKMNSYFTFEFRNCLDAAIGLRAC